MKYLINEKGQAQAGRSVPMSDRAFQNNGEIAVYWLGGGGVMVNSHGTVILIDPVLTGFDMPLLVEPVIEPDRVPHVDGCLISHIDNDHYSRATVRALKGVTREFHGSYYVARQMKAECGADAIGHDWHEKAEICGTGADVTVEVIPVDHDWQNEFAEYNYRHWEKNEYCGYYLRTCGRKLWYVGDSRLMEEHLQMDPPDVIFFDFSDDPYHIGRANACRLADTYPEAKLILIHWGTVDAPDMLPFNGNPADVLNAVTNPERIVILAPGEKYSV